MSDSFKAVIFGLGNEEFGIHIEQVVSIERVQPESITAIPKMPKHVLGMMQLRGVVIPVVDLHQALLEKSMVVTDTTRIVVVSQNARSIGLIVDAATDVLDIPASTVQPLQFVERQGTDFILGAVKAKERLMMLLDATKLLSAITDLNLLESMKLEN